MPFDGKLMEWKPWSQIMIPKKCPTTKLRAPAESWYPGLFFLNKKVNWKSFMNIGSNGYQRPPPPIVGLKCSSMKTCGNSMHFNTKYQIEVSEISKGRLRPNFTKCILDASPGLKRCAWQWGKFWAEGPGSMSAGVNGHQRPQQRSLGICKSKKVSCLRKN